MGRKVQLWEGCCACGVSFAAEMQMSPAQLGAAALCALQSASPWGYPSHPWRREHAASPEPCRQWVSFTPVCLRAWISLVL